MEKTIQHVAVLPFALMMGVIGAILGLIIALIYAPLFSWAMAYSQYPGAAGLGGMMAGIMIVAFPIFFFIVVFVEGAIIAFLYNVLAPRIGGIRIRFKEDEAPPPMPVTVSPTSD